MKTIQICLSLGLGLALTSAASAQASFEVIDGDVITCNFDGSILLGVDSSDYFVLENGVKTYIPGSMGCTDISDDGTVVYGQAPDPMGGLPSAAIYTASTGWALLGGLPGQSSPANEDSSAYQISGDGATAVGLGWRTNFTARGFRWRAGTGLLELPQMGPNSSRASAVSRDGMWIGGFDEAPNGPRRAALWDENFNEVLLLIGVTTDGIGEVNGLNSDGSVACGAAASQGFVWNPGDGAVTFGPFPGFDSNRAFATSDDGEVVVGNATTFPFNRLATIWTPSSGNQGLKDVLIANGANIGASLGLEFALGISEDGQTIVGRGFDPASGFFGFRAFLPRCGTTESFCSSTPNSSGGPAIMDSNGMTSIGANGFSIEVDSVPNDTGLFFYSLGQAAGGSGTPFGNGLLCIGGGESVTRLAPQVATGNANSNALDFTALPPNSPPVLAGDVWNFQYWFRDPGVGASFDTSDGLAVSWCP